MFQLGQAQMAWPLLNLQTKFDARFEVKDKTKTGASVDTLETYEIGKED